MADVPHGVGVRVVVLLKQLRPVDRCSVRISHVRRPSIQPCMHACAPRAVTYARCMYAHVLKSRAGCGMSTFSFSFFSPAVQLWFVAALPPDEELPDRLVIGFEDLRSKKRRLSSFVTQVGLPDESDLSRKDWSNTSYCCIVLHIVHTPEILRSPRGVEFQEEEGLEAGDLSDLYTRSVSRFPSRESMWLRLVRVYVDLCGCLDARPSVTRSGLNRQRYFRGKSLLDSSGTRAGAQEHSYTSRRGLLGWRLHALFRQSSLYK